MGRGRGAGWARAGFTVSLFALGALVLAGLGTRWGLWAFPTGFLVLRGAALAGLVGALVCVAGALGTRGPASLALALAGASSGLIAAGVPWHWYRTARQVPPIHDITTDWEDPPRFVAVLPLRKGSPNPAEYGGAEVTSQQRRAYPRVAPARLPIPPAEAFQRALGAAGALGWRIVAADPAEGRIEATDTTFWFGFVDDVVVRVASDGPGSRVDVRSVSRVGRSDVGANARRIEAFLTRLGPDR